MEFLVHPHHQDLSHVLLRQLGVQLRLARLLALLPVLVFYQHRAPHLPLIVCHLDLLVGDREEAWVVLVEDVVLRLVILDISQVVLPFLLDLLRAVLLLGRDLLDLALDDGKIHQLEGVELVVLDVHRLLAALALVDVPDLREAEVDLLQHLEGRHDSTDFLLLCLERFSHLLVQFFEVEANLG